MLTDEMAQVHRSPGFINSSLIGKSDDGTLIKEFEASHGTVSDMWNDHLAGQETSLNPLGLVEALISAMQHSVTLQGDNCKDGEKIQVFTEALRKCMHTAMVDGKGTCILFHFFSSFLLFFFSSFLFFFFFFPRLDPDFFCCLLLFFLQHPSPPQAHATYVDQRVSRQRSLLITSRPCCLVTMPTSCCQKHKSKERDHSNLLSALHRSTKRQ